jgi:hypothetical protein
MNILSAFPTHIYKDEAQARKVADLNQQDESGGWTYIVEKITDGKTNTVWIVKIYDETGCFVGNM